MCSGEQNNENQKFEENADSKNQKDHICNNEKT